MEHDAKYIAVGTFVLVAIAVAAIFLVWYSDKKDDHEFELYEIYFTGSVSGLTRGGPVRYLGVDVGRVRRLAIDRDHPGRVTVVVEVDTVAPIDSSTRASLGLQGVTGLLYIDLKQAPGAKAGEPLRQGERYPVIESSASDFDVFLSSLPELVGRATSLIDRVSLLISENNVESLTATIESLRQATDTLPQTAAAANEFVHELRATLAEFHGTARQLRATVDEARPDIEVILERLSKAASDLAAASNRLEGFIENTDKNVGRFTDQGLFELEQLLREGRSALAEFRELSRSLREDPSRILYQPPVSGVEIEP